MTRAVVHLEVRLFGGLTELAGAKSLPVDVPEPATVAELRRAVATQHPVLAQVIASCKVAVDLEVASDTTVLAANHEVALLPPVAGGADQSLPSLRTIEVDGRVVRSLTGLVAASPNSDEALALVRGPSVGATVTFVGTVRDHAEDLDGVIRLEYSAYPAMAERELAVIAEEIARDHPAITGVVLLHAVGDLQVGDTTIVVGCVAAHRAEAFDACRQALEAIKDRVPVWKREHTTDGHSRWVGLPDTAGLQDAATDPLFDGSGPAR